MNHFPESDYLNILAGQKAVAARRRKSASLENSSDSQLSERSIQKKFNSAREKSVYRRESGNGYFRIR